MSKESQTPRLAAERALDFVGDGMTIGLGTGRAAVAFVEALGSRVRDARWKIRTIATSRATAELAEKLGLPLIGLDDVESIDVTVDGADEVDTRLNVIKGRGGALLREKVLASISRRWVLCVGEDKRVEGLGSHGWLPVEVVSFAVSVCLRKMQEMDLNPEIRLAGDAPFVTDNGNLIIDARIVQLPDPSGTHAALRAIPGVVETGLFLGMSPIVITQHGERVDVEGGQ